MTLSLSIACLRLCVAECGWSLELSEIHADREQLFACEHSRQIPELGFDLGGIGHRIRDLLAKDFAIALPEPMNGHLKRPFRGVHFARQLGIRRVGLPEEEYL